MAELDMLIVVRLSKFDFLWFCLELGNVVQSVIVFADFSFSFFWWNFAFGSCKHHHSVHLSEIKIKHDR